MPTNVIMPALELAQETGKVLHWLKAPGDLVRKGESIVEIETDKVTVEIEAPASGILSDVTARAGDVVPVGQTIALIVAPGEAASPLARKTAEQEHSTAAAVPAARLAAASPKARRLAAERGRDVSALRGSGPGGAVVAADVATAKLPEVPPARSVEAPGVSTVWRIMAERMTASWTTAPPWKDGAIVRNADINIGLAVAIDDGLVVPVLHRADTLSLAELATCREDLVSRAQAGKLRPPDIQGGGFTISNLGMYGVDAFNAIVNPPQAAILAVGRIADRVVALNGQPAVQPTMVLTLSCDHRALDGARGAQFLGALAELIEEPLALLV